MKFVTGSVSEAESWPRGFFYLAAPFFNAPQLELVRQIEEIFEVRQRGLFSPRLQHKGDEKVPKVLDEKTAQTLFVENRRAIEAAAGMLAVTDYLLPRGEVLRSCQGAGGEGNAKVFGPPLELPDTGTVWELGYAHAMLPPGNVILFTSKPAGSGSMNIMLSQSAAGICYGLSNLKRFLETGNSKELGRWQGRHR